jgi:hypothetical protein
MVEILIEKTSLMSALKILGQSSCWQVYTGTASWDASDEKGDFVGTAVREVSLFNECVLFVCLCCPAYVWFCLSCQKPQLQVFFHMSEIIVFFYENHSIFFMDGRNSIAY